MKSSRSLPKWLGLLEQRSPESLFRLGLERVSSVWNKLGITPPAGRVLSVAGTNGKGSCALFAEAALKASGLKVGTTLSPHLVRFNERIRLNGREASDERICEALQAIELAREEVDLSYFEHVILAALYAFDTAQLDAWVLEVGLGGRLDAVNVVDADVAIISSIALEHTDWLGNSLDAIGREKAGILRPGKPLVCGSASMPRSVFSQADKLGCTMYLPGKGFRYATTEAGFDFDADIGQLKASWKALPTPRVAPENAATALMASLLLLGDAGDVGDDLIQRPAIESACQNAANPGRLERRALDGTSLVLDLAHNPDAARFLRAQLAREAAGGRTRALAGFLADKDVAGTVAALDGLVDEWHFVPTPGARGRSAQEVADLARLALEGAPIKLHRNVRAAIGELKGVSCASDRLLVFGSFATVGEARKFFDQEASAEQGPRARPTACAELPE